MIKKMIKLTTLFAFILIIVLSLASCDVILKVFPFVGNEKATSNDTISTETIHGGTTSEGTTPEEAPVKPDPNAPTSTGLAYIVNDDGKTCTITGIGSCTERDIIIGQEIDGYKITTIGENALTACKTVTSFTISHTVTKIELGALVGCPLLKHISVVEGNPNYYSENNCLIETNTKKLILGCSNSVIPTNITSIGSYAFSLSSIISVTIPNSVTTIEDYAFLLCYKLVEVYNLSSIKITKSASDNGGIGAFALNVYTPTNGKSKLQVDKNGCIFFEDVNVCYLMGYRGNNPNLVLPESFNGKDYEFFQNAFYGCDELTNVTIPYNIKKVNSSVFSGRSKNLCVTITIGDLSELEKWEDFLKKDFTQEDFLSTSLILLDGITTIDDEAFYGCDALVNITLPNSLTKIGRYAFRECNGLTTITIPDNVHTLGKYAFWGCDNLFEVNLGTSLIYIAGDAFGWCKNLANITVKSDNGHYYSIGNCLISKSEYSRGSLIVGCKDSIIPTDGSIESISSHAFYGRTSLTTITIPNGVTWIGDSAFFDCDGLTSITIPASVTRIGDTPFGECSNLASIIVESGNSKYHSDGNCLIKTETQYLIAGCKNSVIPSDGSVTKIDWHAFSGRTGLTNITIPDSITYIGAKAFYGCTNLTNITIPKNVTAIGEYAFYNCDSLTSIIIPDNVTTIGENAFKHCDKLSELILGTGLKEIGRDAFVWCHELTNITFGGTTAQWKAITKKLPVVSNSSNYTCTIHCADGDL